MTDRDLSCIHGRHALCHDADCPCVCHARPESVLQEAQRIIHGQRRQDYGGPLDSFERIGKLWAPILGVDVTAEQVALCMIGLKIARAMQGFHRDSIVDIAGYAGCIELIQAERDALEESA